MPPKKNTNTYEQDMEEVQSGYIDQVLKYLRKEQQQVVSNKEFVSIYGKVIY